MPNPQTTQSERARCVTCQAVTDAGKPTNCPNCPENRDGGLSMTHDDVPAVAGPGRTSDRLREMRVHGRPIEKTYDDLWMERDLLAEALDDLHRYSLIPDHGYAGSPCEAKVRAALEAVGRTSLAD